MLGEGELHLGEPAVRVSSVHGTDEATHQDLSLQDGACSLHGMQLSSFYSSVFLVYFCICNFTVRWGMFSAWWEMVFFFTYHLLINYL